MSSQENGLLTDRFNGQFRLTDGFDLSCLEFSSSDDRALYIAETVPLPLMHRGAVIEDYPFTIPFSKLKVENEDQQPILTRLNNLIEELNSLGTQHGIHNDRLYWALSETIQNATQYGGTQRNPTVCTILNLNWDLTLYPDGATLNLAVTNPCRSIFDPSKYLMLTIEEICDLVTVEKNNAHLGTTTLLGYSGKIEYAWQLPNGDRILFSMEKMTDEEIAQSPEYEQYPVPTKRIVERIDSQGESIPYGIDDFLRDAKQQKAAESVVIVYQLVAQKKMDESSAPIEK